MADIPVQIIITAKDQASAVLKRVGGTAAKTGKDFASLKKDAVIASAGILAIGAGAYKLASDAAKFESVKDAFGGMTEGMIDDYDSFVRNVKAGSRGTLSEFDILKGGTKALSLIGKESFSNFEKDFARAANLTKRAARATGQDVNYLFDSLITGTARSSKLILDNLGITLNMSEAQEKYKDNIMETTGATEEAAKKGSLWKAVLEELDSTYAGVEASSGGLSGAQQELRATMEDLKIEIGMELLPVFNELVRAITPLAKEHLPKLAESLKGLIGSFMSLPKEVKIVSGLLVALLPILVGLGVVLMPLISVFKILAVVIGVLASPIGLVIGVIGLFIFSLKVMWDNLNKYASFLRGTVFPVLDSLRDKFQGIADAIRNAINKARELASAGLGQLGLGGGRQFGGPVMPGLAYTVGEAGPETFIPMVPGRIAPAGGEAGMSQSNYIEQVIIQSPMDIDTFMRQLSFELKTRGV